MNKANKIKSVAYDPTRFEWVSQSVWDPVSKQNISGYQTVADCLNYLKLSGQGDKKLAFWPDSNSREGKGWCYTTTSKYNPDSDNSSGNMEIYQISSNPSCDRITDQNVNICTSLDYDKFLKAKEQLSSEINAKQNSLRDYEVAIYSLEKGISNEQARTDLENLEREKRRKADSEKIKEKIELHNKQLMTLTNSMSNQGIQLSDKNRLLATTNSNIQKKFLTLTNVNDQINTLTQDVNESNQNLERKDQIIKTLKAMIIILFILFVVMIAYYFSGNLENQFPNTFGAIKGTITNIKNIF